MSSPLRFIRAGNTNNNSSNLSTANMTSINGQTNAASSTSSFGGVSQAEMEDLRHAFQLFDTEKKGKILLKDVRSVLESIFNTETTNSSTTTTSTTNTLHRVISRLRSLDSNNNNNDTTQLSLPEFIQLMTQPDPKHDKRSEVRRVFDLFDVERKGFINVEDLGRVAVDLGENMDRQEVQEMIHRASSSASSSSGKVYPQDFEAVMNKRLFS